MADVCEMLQGPVVSIHQPAYLPWLGYLDRIRRSDIFIFLDTVQFQKNSFQNRNKVRTAQGWTWLTVPVESKGYRERRLHELSIDNRRAWQRKHWMTLSQAYARAPYFDSLSAWLKPFYENPWTRLADLCHAMLQAHLDVLEINTELRRASATYDFGTARGELVLDLCRAAGAGTYISGPLGRDYLDEAAFHAAGIQLVFDDYHHPTYPQAHSGFESHLAAIDLIANSDQPRTIMVQGAR